MFAGTGIRALALALLLPAILLGQTKINLTTQVRSPVMTTNTVPKWTGTTGLADSNILDDGTHAARDDKGYDVNTLGALIYWVPNNTITGTTVNKMVCDDGTGKGIICPHTTSTTNDPLGVAIATNGATPGTSGSTGICNIGFCTQVMDNSATANHYAQQSTTIDGDLSDVGATPPTNGQPYWHIFVGNSGAGTTAIFRNMDSSELNATSGGNGKSTTVQINGVATKNIANYATGGGVAWSKVDSGNTSTITSTVNSPTGNIAGSWVNISGNYTVQDSDNVNRLRFTSSAAAITLPQPGTITSSPIIAVRAQVNMGAGGSPFTSSSFVTTAGHQMWISVQANGNTAISSLALSTGDSCSLQSSTFSADATYVYFCPSLIGGGSVTVNVSYTAGSATQIGLFALETTGTAIDTATTAASSGGFIDLSVTNAIHFTNAMSIVGQQNGTPSPQPGFIQRDTLFNGNVGSIFTRFLSNANSLSLTSLQGQTFSQTIVSISSHPAFTAGWQVVMENASTGIQTVTSTSSTINGQTTLVLAPNEICNFLSNGTNWDAICGFTPNIQFNGAIGNQIQIGYAQNLSRGSDVGTTTINTTGAADAFYTVDADVNCDSAVSTGVAMLTITFTDTSNTVQTYTANAACTTLGSSSIGSIRQAFRAKASTNIQYGVAHTGAQPTFDVSVAVNQLSTK